MNTQDDFDFNTWRPSVLVLGSGGIKGVSELGGIYYFWLKGCLDNVNTYIGSSVGAIVGALLAMNWLPHQILEISLETTLFNNYTEIKWTQVMDEFGLVPNSSFDDALARQLRNVIKKKCNGKVPTLSEFYKITKKRVIFTIVSLRYEKAYYVDYKSHPNLDLLEAMRMTSNSPLIFGKLEHQKDYMVDGAVLDPLPINHLDDGMTQILAIGVQDKKHFDISKIGFLSYYDRIISLPLSELIRYAIANASDQCYAVIIPVSEELSMLDDGKNKDIRMEMFLNAHKFVEMFTSHQKPNKPKVSDTTMKISKSAILTCLKTHTAKFLLRAMKEEPDIFKDALTAAGINIDLFSKPKESEEPVVSDKKPEIIPEVQSKQIIVVNESDKSSESDDSSETESEEILEINPTRITPSREKSPNNIFNNMMDEVVEMMEIIETADEETLNNIFTSTFPSQHSRPRMTNDDFFRNVPIGIQISINLDEDAIEGIFDMCMKSIKMLNNAGGLLKALRYDNTS